jgi:hypothetical protein
MKTKLIAIALVAVAALALAPKPARAGDEGLAAIGGFIGGVIVGSVINDSRHDNHGYIGVDVGYNNGGYRGDHGYRGDYGRGNHHGHRHGYWKEVRVRHWVPGRWIVECDRYGREYRRMIPGHYVYRMDRVWVSNDRYDRYDRYDRDGRYDRGYGYHR